LRPNTTFLASSHHKKNQKHYSKQIKNHTLACASAPSHSDLSFHCFCKCKKLLYNFISKIHNPNKAIYYTHKIKRKKEYEFSKQKNNRIEILSLFSVLKIYTLSEELPSFESTFLKRFQQKLFGHEKNKKINKKKVKISSSFKKRKFKPTVFNKISTLHFRSHQHLIKNKIPLPHNSILKIRVVFF
ncbi:hypothetical protein, partial [Flavobacterium psychrophilum]